MNQEIKYCTIHKDKVAVAFCNKCTSSLCAKCIITIEDKKICKICYDNFIYQKASINFKSGELACNKCNHLNPARSNHCNNCGKLLITDVEERKPISNPQLEPNEILPNNGVTKSSKAMTVHDKQNDISKTASMPPPKKEGIQEFFNSVNSHKSKIVAIIFSTILALALIKLTALIFQYSLSLEFAKQLNIILFIQLLIYAIFVIYCFFSKKYKSYRLIALGFLIIYSFIYLFQIIALDQYAYADNDYNHGIEALRNKNYDQAYSIFAKLKSESNTYKNSQSLYDSVKSLVLSDKYDKAIQEFKKNNYKPAHLIFQYIYKEDKSYKNVKSLLDSAFYMRIFEEAQIEFKAKNYESAKNKIEMLLPIYNSSEQNAQLKNLLDKIKYEEKILNEKAVKAKKLAALQEEKEKRSAAIEEERASASYRKAYAEILRTIYLDKGLNIRVTVYGENNTIIKLTYALFDEVWAHNFQKGTIIPEIQKYGFKRVVLSDGYDYEVYWTFN